MDNRELYNRERNRRWNMAKEKEPEAIEAICRILGQTPGHRVEKMRYDEIWFRQYAPDSKYNAWVRGASDYVIRIDGERYVYAEIKLKSVKFKKTNGGGTTQKGSVVADYGCESFYLDIVPVYENMCAFVEKTKIEDRNFIIFFIDDGLSEVHAISLEKIRSMERDGFGGQPLCIFSEGYGTATKYGAAPNYLIPELATERLSFDYIERHSTAVLTTVLPEEPKYYYAGTDFYHCDRNCKYIAGKRDGNIQRIMYGEVRDKKLVPCRECCRGPRAGKGT